MVVVYIFVLIIMALNSNIVIDAWPFPRIDELLSYLYGMHIFSKLDLYDGYH